jgi:hypothetical protein
MGWCHALRIQREPRGQPGLLQGAAPVPPTRRCPPPLRLFSDPSALLLQAAAGRMQTSAASTSSSAGDAGPGAAAAAAVAPDALSPRISSALSFREVGDWFRNLGDDLGNVIGLPRSAKSMRRSPTPSGTSRPDLGPLPRLPSTSILARRQQVCRSVLPRAVLPRAVLPRDVLVFVLVFTAQWVSKQ